MIGYCVSWNWRCLTDTDSVHYTTARRQDTPTMYVGTLVLWRWFLFFFYTYWIRTLHKPWACLISIFIFIFYLFIDFLIFFFGPFFFFFFFLIHPFREFHFHSLSLCLIYFIILTTFFFHPPADPSEPTWLFLFLLLRIAIRLLSSSLLWWWLAALCICWAYNTATIPDTESLMAINIHVIPWISRGSLLFYSILPSPSFLLSFYYLSLFSIFFFFLSTVELFSLLISSSPPLLFPEILISCLDLIFFLRLTLFSTASLAPSSRSTFCLPSWSEITLRCPV